MLIRRPVSTVFEAFIDPDITTNFWFTKSSGKLELGKTVTWHWEMYGVSGEVKVQELIPDEKISINWGEPATTVDFLFKALREDMTYVTINHYGFQVSGDALIKEIKDNTSGFTTVLDGLKAYLEHGIKLNLIADKYPAEVMQHPK
ncbi:MAG: polyketide cyclase [Saprospiraceae bacterium]|nr:polyketide cyclase [Saprospiraceae bacterium]